MLNIIPVELAKELHENVCLKYKEFRSEVHKSFHLNRMYFLEVILLYIDEIHALDRSKITDHPNLTAIYQARQASWRFA